MQKLTQPATESPERTCPDQESAGGVANTSLIIIDEDELNFNNESQVIQRIIEEYEKRLQEQLALARQDIATELEQQIKVSGTGRHVACNSIHCTVSVNQN